MQRIEKHSQPLSSSRDLPEQEQLLMTFAEVDRMARIEAASPNYKVMTKSDGSFVTSVDLTASPILCEKLPLIYPGIVISEEAIPPYETRRSAKALWIIDPIDNTKGLVEHGLHESFINIALFVEGRPRLAGIHRFRDNSTIIGSIEGGVFLYEGDSITQITRGNPQGLPRFVAYKATLEEMSSMMQDLLRPAVSAGSEIVHRSKLPERLQSIVLNEADVYLEPRGIKSWDLAAGISLVQFLGGRAESLATGASLDFNTESLVVEPFKLGYF